MASHLMLGQFITLEKLLSIREGWSNLMRIQFVVDPLAWQESCWIHVYVPTFRALHILLDGIGFDVYLKEMNNDINWSPNIGSIVQNKEVRKGEAMNSNPSPSRLVAGNEGKRASVNDVSMRRSSSGTSCNNSGNYGHNVCGPLIHR